MPVRKHLPRRKIIAQRGGGCQKCGRQDNINIHHIVAVSDGGNDEVDNLAVLCGGCHKEWHSLEMRTRHTFDFWLKFPPLNYILYTLSQPCPEGLTGEEYRQAFFQFHVGIRDFRRASEG